MQAGRLQAAYEKYQDRADFWWIYVAEAHAIDDPRPSTRVKIMEHRSFEERTEVATGCAADLNLSIPKLIDDMDNTIAEAYQGAPDRLFIIGKDSKIAYSGAKGPRGFDVAEMEGALAAILEGKVPEITRAPEPEGRPRGAGGGGGGGDAAKQVAAMDANKDGLLTKQELPERAQMRFAHLDTNGDGHLDAAEQAAFVERMKTRGGKGKGKGRSSQ